jgi:hypothetical protein
MAKKEQHAIQLKPSEGPHSDGTLYITNFDKNDRLKRAAKVLGLCWLGAAGSIPIIIAHWVLVPGFLIAGPIMAYKRMQQHTLKEHVTGKCPHCKKEITMNLDAADQLPKWDYCPNCNKSIQMVE